MIARRISTATGRTAVGENDVTVGTVRGWAGSLPPLIYCHGSGATALAAFSAPWQRQLINTLAQRYLVTVPDLGGETWGNDTGVARVEAARLYLASLGATGSVTLVTASMGTLNALAYTLAHPTNVAAVAATIPALDLVEIHANHGTEFTTAVDAAYPPAYDDTTHGPTHNPVRYATSLPTDLPIHLWTSSNDTYAVPSTADQFVTLRPQTGRTDMGPVDHGDPSLANQAEPIATWLAQV